MARRRFPIGTALFLLFSLFTLLEIYTLIVLIRATGLLFTILWTFVMAFAGAALARHEGLAVIQRLHGDLAAGRIPARPLLEGVFILLGGALLITPGLISDTMGILILVPPFRRLCVSLAIRWIKRHFRIVDLGVGGPDGRGEGGRAGHSPNSGEVIDAEFWEDD